MSEEKRTIKGLLLQLRLTLHLEGKIACEEEIVQISEDLEARRMLEVEELQEKLKIALAALGVYAAMPVRTSDWNENSYESDSFEHDKGKCAIKAITEIKGAAKIDWFKSSSTIFTLVEEPLEIWVNIYDSMPSGTCYWGHTSKESATGHPEARDGFTRTAKFREVKL